MGQTLGPRERLQMQVCDAVRRTIRKSFEPLFFLLAAKRISADRREHLCHHGCLREIALLFAPIYFFSAYGEAKRISENSASQRFATAFVSGSLSGTGLRKAAVTDPKKTGRRTRFRHGES